MATSNIAHLMASYPHTYLAISLRPLAQPSERRAIRNGHRLREGKRVGENQCHGLRANQISFAKSWRERRGAEPRTFAGQGAALTHSATPPPAGRGVKYPPPARQSRAPETPSPR